MKKIIKYLFISLFVIIICYMSLGIINSFFGWYGHKPWEMRRSTFGDIKESKERSVFVKKLSYLKERKDTIDFDIYIERGFKWGKHSSKSTIVLEDSIEYPYQIPFPIDILPKNLTITPIEIDTFYNIYNYNILIKENNIKDTILFQIKKFDTINRKWGKFNIIKVWDEGSE